MRPNMKQLIAVAAATLVVGAGFTAQTVNAPTNVPFHQLPKAEQEARIAAAQEHRLRRTGGEVSREGSQKGKILFVNAQAIVPAEEMVPIVNALAKRSRLDISMIIGNSIVSPQTAGTAKAASGADVVVFVVDDADSTIMLLNAPEDGWAIVNAKAVVEGARNDVFRAARLRKEMQRAFFSVAGAMNSNFPNSLMGSIRQPRDLDKLGEDISLDVYSRTMENLKSIGVTPTQVTTYLQACKLGWAPAPTNDVQKAIWERVRADKERGPSNPMRINPPRK